MCASLSHTHCWYEVGMLEVHIFMYDTEGHDTWVVMANHTKCSLIKRFKGSVGRDYKQYRMKIATKHNIEYYF